MSLAVVLAVPASGFAQELVGRCVTVGNPCQDQGQCGEGQLCAEGICLTLGVECKSPDACGDDPKVSCIALYGACKSELDCKAGGFCGQGGQCVLVLGGEPIGGPDGGFGEPPPACRDQSDCAPGDICTPEGFCVPPLKCASDGDCGPGRCDLEQGFCVPPDGPAPGGDCGGDPNCVEPDCGTEGAPCPGRTNGPTGGEDSGGSTGATDTSAEDRAAAEAMAQAAKEEAEKKAEVPALCSVSHGGTGRASLAAGLMLLALSSLVSRRSRRVRVTR